jgi:hypothetical protein
MTRRASKALKPSKLTISSYQVGFGDCFLLSFHYSDANRHVLMDFGTKLRSNTGFKADMVKIANQIAEDCGRVDGKGGKLTLVVATHRHYDHISGFATKKNGKGPGDIIRSLKPDLVIQPWTEDPHLPANATGPKDAQDSKSLAAAHAITLKNMQLVAEATAHKLSTLVDTKDKTVAAVATELSYLGSDNIENRSAVENLMNMGRLKPKYLHLGSTLDLSRLLPGVKVHVFGPPTLDQSEAIKRYATTSDQYWKLQALAAENGPSLAPAHPALGSGHKDMPISSRWFVHRLCLMRAESLLEIVRSLDSVMNNTSLILLFEVGSKRLLFPGDAQVEDWSCALSNPKIKKLLEDVDVYKVGHHGSHNATPVDLWHGFKNRNKQSFNTFLSTRGGEYNNVPLSSLEDALKTESHLHSTEDFKAKEIFERTTIQF